jgi:hypothetical protein
MAHGEREGFPPGKIACKRPSSRRTQFQLPGDPHGSQGQADVVIHLRLGDYDDRDHGLDILSADSHRESWLHVCISRLEYCTLLNTYRSIAKSQLLNIPTSVLSITIIAVSGYVCTRPSRESVSCIS